jgi:SAM-dependent methyltransferase
LREFIRGVVDVAQPKFAWHKAQEAERKCWLPLWDESNTPKRQECVSSETIKQTFLVQELEKYFGISFEHYLRDKATVDVGCGPVSYLARLSIEGERTGVDPLRYPDWVYEQYKRLGFTVHLTPFEDFKVERKYDVALFYNALQHFRNLNEVGQKCAEVVNDGGEVFLSEYLRIPRDEAHIQYLTRDSLDHMFPASRFIIDSTIIKVRLPGYVERVNGEPVDLYLGRAFKRKQQASRPL